MLHCFAGTEMESIGSRAMFVCEAAPPPRRGQHCVYCTNTNRLTAASFPRITLLTLAYMAFNHFTNKTLVLFMFSAHLLEKNLLIVEIMEIVEIMFHTSMKYIPMKRILYLAKHDVLEFDCNYSYCVVIS